MQINLYHVMMSHSVFELDGPGTLCTMFGLYVYRILEEKFLKHRNLPVAQVVGMEGMWGVILMCSVVLPAMYYLPGADGGSYENAYEALYMLAHSHTLMWLVMGYVVSIAFYNFLGLNVSKHLSTVHRTLIDGLRTTVVWIVDLIIFYFVNEAYGEAWNDYSLVQLAGFGLLLLGTLVYNKILRLPGFVYPKEA